MDRRRTYKATSASLQAPERLGVHPPHRRPPRPSQGHLVALAVALAVALVAALAEVLAEVLAEALGVVLVVALKLR